ncbi:AMP-binding protein [Nonomuraea sp. CA-141351]|uniref:AMP-binding protein n=1 Tax=Nonomuraea sp. CA-141351 TaxID=3239996 RepID=UPI003D8BE761
MSSPPQRVAELLSVYGAADACAAELLCDRHPADAVAFTVVEPDLSSRDLTFGRLREESARFATGLAELGVGRGDRVATLMGKSADLVVATLAIWRLGAVQVPLFTAFAPPAIALRVEGAKVVVADEGQRDKLASISQPVVAGPAFRELPPYEGAVAVGGDGLIIELFTSGTTGAPKAVPVPLRAVAAMRMYQEYGLNHAADDVFWNAADPGWAYGLYYAIVGPLALGRRALLLHGGFSAELTWRVLSHFGVTNFAAAPTVYRALRNAPAAEPRLRRCSSAGEPLNPDMIEWAEKALGVPILDHYGQTELGMAVANGWHPDILAGLRLGSMGRELPGWRLKVLRPDSEQIAPPGVLGRVAVDVEHSPLMWFTGYRGGTAPGRWYFTGDTASRDADGYFFFASRDDDVILMAGYRIGPFEVESVLLEHDDVAEAAVVGTPDELRGEIVVAYVVLRSGAVPSEALAGELQRLVKERLAAHAYPREVRFVDGLPKTPSGKLQRFLLREGGSA